jgi:hypothetical protein
MEIKSHLSVITKARKLFGYIAKVTEKSPKQFRVVFVNRLQNHSLDVIEHLIEANLTKLDSENIASRKKLQHTAFVRLKMLSYLSLTAKETGVLTVKQYETVAKQVDEVCALLVGWGKNDSDRVKKI